MATYTNFNTLKGGVWSPNPSLCTKRGGRMIFNPSVSGGKPLPALTNPAGAANIQSGYQAINGEGEVVTGTAAVKTFVNGTISLTSSMGASFKAWYVTNSGAVYNGSMNISYSGPIADDSLLVVYDSSDWGAHTTSGGVRLLESMNSEFYFYSVTGDFNVQSN